MTFLQLAPRLLTYFAPEEREIPDSSTYPGRNADVLGAINGALQELYGESGPWTRNRDAGTWLNAPATSVPITVTNGSATASISSGAWKAWFAGCTIAIDGSTIDNRIMNADSSAIVLKFPHDGPTGTTTATIYHDSIAVPTDVAKVLEPVRIQGLRMSPMGNAGDGLTSRSVDDYSFRRKTLDVVQTPGRIATRLARPAGYYTDTWLPSASAMPQIRLYLSTAPAESMQVEYKAVLVAPLGAALNTDPIPVPLDYVESLLLPIARQRLTASDFFRSESAKPEIQRAFGVAMKLLETLKPRTRRSMRVRPTH
jgi:hypothetical protein